GQERLVDLDPGVAGDAAVDDDLVAGTGAEEVAGADLFRIDPAARAFPRGGGPGTGKQGDVVETAFGADFLEQTDADVDEDETGGDYGVGVATEDGEADADAKEGDVDQGEGVVADDLEVGAAGGLPDVVDLAAGAT